MNVPRARRTDPPAVTLPQGSVPSIDGLHVPWVDDALPAALFIHDHDGRFVEVNARACESVGYSRSELLAMSVFDVEQDFDLASAQVAWDGLPNAEVNVLFGHHRRKDGLVFPVEVHFGTLETGERRLYVGIVHDITARRKAEQGLIQSEIQYRAVTETATDGFWILDSGGRLVATNASYIRLSGYSREDLLTMHIWDLDRRESRDDALAHLARIRERGFDLYETEHGSRWGDSWPAEVNVVHWPQAGDRFFVFLRDLRARRLAERRVSESEARLRATFEQAAVGMAHVTADGEWLVVNAKFREIAGRSQRELEALTFPDILHPEDSAATLARLDGMFGERTAACSLEVRCIRGDGTSCWVNVALSPAYRADGMPPYSIVVLQEIDSRIKAQDAVRESGLFVQGILDSLASHIAVVDHEGTIVSVNEAWRKFSLDNSPIPGQPTPGTEIGACYFAHCASQDVEVSADALRAKEGILAVISGRQARFTLEYPCHTESARHWFEMTVTPLALTSRGAVVVHTDITERKRLEAAAAERTSQMELLLKQQVALQTAAAFAHELNQPLVSICAYNEAALRILRDGAERRDVLARALQGSSDQSQRAGQVLHDLMSQLHDGSLETGSFRVADVVETTLAAVRRTRPDNFRVDLDIPPDLPFVHGNPLQTEKALENLLRNGLEAMEDAGVVRLAMHLQARANSDGRHVEIAVSDEGPGVPPGAANRLFEPFYSTKKKGMGMGLAISRSLLEAQGGRLWVDQHPGLGAVFRFTLPIEDAGFAPSGDKSATAEDNS